MADGRAPRRRTIGSLLVRGVVLTTLACVAASGGLFALLSIQVVTAGDHARLRDVATLVADEARVAAADASQRGCTPLDVGSDDADAVVVDGRRSCAGAGTAPRLARPSADIEDVLDGNSSTAFGELDVDGRRRTAHATKVDDRTTLLVYRTSDLAGDLRDRLLRILLGVLLLTAAVTAVVGRSVARRIVRPVDAMTSDLASVGHGASLEHRLPAGTTGLEVDEWRVAVNSLLERVEQADRARRDLVLDLSHDLRTPLVSIRTNAQLLGRGVADADADELRSMVHDIEQQSARLVAAMDAVLDAADVDAEHDSFTAEFADSGSDPAEVVRRAVDAVAAQFPDARIKLDDQAGSAQTSAPASALARIVENLLRNACEHGATAGAGARVLVRVEPSGAIIIRDHGPGMPAGVRSAPSSSRGRGLRIVDELAAAHGLDVTWGAPADGAGTQVRITTAAVNPP